MGSTTQIILASCTLSGDSRIKKVGDHFVAKKCRVANINVYLAW